MHVYFLPDSPYELGSNNGIDWDSQLHLLPCFKKYDVRGRVGVELSADLAYRFGKAVASALSASAVVVGRDNRVSSLELAEAVSDGLRAGGSDAYHLGLCGTEEVYFAVDHLNASAGVMVTASHNPIEYNGFKIVGHGASPLSEDAFREIEVLTAKSVKQNTQNKKCSSRQVDSRDAYVERVCSFISPEKLTRHSLLVNPGNGCAGPTFDAIHAYLATRGATIQVARINHRPDGTFPNGIPNPLIPGNRRVTSEAVLANRSNLGLAWDGDFDRCFFFDERGDFVPGEYIVGLLARAALRRSPGAKVVHDPRVVWNTISTVKADGGIPVVSKTGHALVKARMRETGAVYGGEMSAHHYFKDFMFCDSGMVPWLLLLEQMSELNAPLSELVDEMRARHPSSGEINFQVPNAPDVVDLIHDIYASDAINIDLLDGLSAEFKDWRFNVRASNTEPLLRLNVESRGDPALVRAKTAELSDIINKGVRRLM